MKWLDVAILVSALTGWLGLAPAHAGEANCLGRIACDPATLPPTYEAVDALVKSSGVLDQAALQVDAVAQYCKESDIGLSIAVSASFESVGESQCMPASQPSSGGRPAGAAPGMPLFGRLSVHVIEDVPESDACARRILASVTTRLRDLLVDLGAADAEQQKGALTAAQEDVQRATERLAALRKRGQELCDQAGRPDLERQPIVTQLDGWRRDLEHMDMQLVAQHARQKALSEQIARIGQQAEQATTQDPVAAELQKVVALREKEVERRAGLVAQKLASQEELDQSQEKLAQARAALAAQQQHLFDGVGGNLLADINRDLVNVSVQIADLEAQRQQVAALLDRAQQGKLLQLADRYEQEVGLHLRAATRDCDEAVERAHMLERHVRTYHAPSVVILGGLPEKP